MLVCSEVVEEPMTEMNDWREASVKMLLNIEGHERMMHLPLDRLHSLLLSKSCITVAYSYC